MKEYKYLPYGSVVSVKDRINKLMIVGYMVKAEGFKTYDYCGIELPRGFQKMEDLIAFNNSSIKEVHYKGYTDETLASFYEDVEWIRGEENDN